MRRPRKLGASLLAAFAALALVGLPMAADARPGGGFSSGSRGSRTYSAPPSTRTAPGGGVSNFDRTETPRGGFGQTAPAQRPSYTPAPARGGLFGGGGFMSGLMGGLLGAGLVGMLFGSGAFGGAAGFSGFLGFLLQIALLVGLAMLVMRFFRRRAAEGMSPAMAGAAPAGRAPPNAYAREAMAGGSAGGGMAAARSAPVQVGQADFQAFERMLVDINAAWSRGDMATLQRLATPEMARYFAGDLQDLAARGWSNETRDVRLESGDLAEAWNEQGLDYATVAMRFSLVDVTRDAQGRVVEGDPETRQMVTELWSFVRRPGQPWRLSAIQQAR
ncbi:Tim44 domain-containing protein [Roseomonas sp. OT10]|uniref:Tim44 domain-containing protein n=1 Tax=Roseomonas cutis TaxID=2897332 RepID=UPI001E5026EF|nr:TIM44-like domain-containing protein [Roseomonas sp. OT10]UFN46823.1 Tim44 domain-containing protein [Roseomonas sp. OT10]